MTETTVQLVTACYVAGLMVGTAIAAAYSRRGD
jgi:hypothetical protein